MVNPQADQSMSTSFSGAEAQVETGEAKITMPQIKIKQSYGKLGLDNEAALSTEGDAEGEEKSKGAKIKMPKVSFSHGKTDSFVKDEGSSSGFNGEEAPSFHNGSKDVKAKPVKIKLPKVEFTSPYSKTGSEQEVAEMSARLVTEPSGGDAESKGVKDKSGKMSFPRFKMTTETRVEEEERGNVVWSLARTEMLERENSESPTGLTFGGPSCSLQVEAQSEEMEPEVTKSSTCFKVPKFHLKPHSTGFLDITPEGSPKASRTSLQVEGLEGETAGTFRLQTSGIGFSTQEVSEEHHMTTSSEGTVTMVTKTTKHTVTETSKGGSHTTVKQYQY